MIALIKGILIYTAPVSIIVETNGVGYRIFIPANVFAKLPSLNEPISLHTTLVIRELSHALYGFFTAQDRDLFEILMGVTGIGPKLALSLIGHLQIPDLNRAINNHDILSICKVPGIGKKIAERLIIEMRDKINSLCAPDPSEMGIVISKDLHQQKISDAMGALINLGYNQATAQKAIKKTLNDIPENFDLAELITNALKHT